MKYSVIIPTLNQAPKLKRCLNNLSELDFDPKLFEVFVIDNGSTDNTKTVAKSFKNKIENLYYHFCAEPGLMAARHRGFEKSNGEILCYIDDDSLVDQYWLSGIEDSFQDDSVVLVGGPSIPKYEIDPPPWIEYFWQQNEHGKANYFLSLLDFGDYKLIIKPTYVLGCNYSIRKKVFIELGGTHPDYLPEKYKYFQGDGESGLSMKVHRSKFRTLYHPKVKILHLIPESRLTVDYFCWRRYFNGIHSSYSGIRRQYGVDNLNYEKRVSIGRKIYRRIKRKITDGSKQENYKNASEPKEIKKIREKIRESYEAGYRYHQEEVKKDPKLREWVLRENYLGENGTLPE